MENFNIKELENLTKDMIRAYRNDKNPVSQGYVLAMRHTLNRIKSIKKYQKYDK